jgi:hypothetical protein
MAAKPKDINIMIIDQYFFVILEKKTDAEIKIIEYDMAINLK